jgi:membrane protein DedA with SNARE-associated domain
VDSLIATAAATAAHHPGLATLVAFAGAVVEAVALLGVIIPGTPILMAVAAAAGLAGLPMAPILFAAVIGAIIGDGVSFWLGRRYGGRIRAMWPLASRPKLVGRAEIFFERFGTPSIALARFVPVLRSTVPLVAGMAGMRVRPFLAANVLSALVWAPAHVLPAQLFGLAVGRIETGEGSTVAVTTVALLLVAAGACTMHRLWWKLRKASRRP